MAIEKKLIHFSKLSDFETQLNAGNILDYSIVFIQDAKKIWTHGQYYDCNGGNGTSDSIIYITDFDVLSLYDLATIVNPDEDDGIQASKPEIIDALSANKIVLVPYEISENAFYRGYAMLVGYVEDLLYFKVITDHYEIIVETGYSDNLYEIRGQEVTLREWANKQDTLVSGTNIKTINGESIVGSGNLVIEDGTYIWEWDGSESGTITQDQWDALQSANNILFKINNTIYIPQTVGKTENRISMNQGYRIGPVSWTFASIAITSDLSYLVSSQNVTYIKSGDLKTINGESLEGSGDIIISGGSSSGSSAYSEVSHGTADTTFTLTPNTFHIWDEVSSLTLTLGAETSGVANEYLFQFTSGSEPTTLSLPDDIKWTDGETPTIEANKIYQISILKGLGSVLEWDSKSMIIFTVTKTTTPQTFSCESGMTWEEFINSEYNNNTFAIYTQYNNQIRWTDQYQYCVVGVSPSSVIENNIEYTSKYGD